MPNRQMQAVIAELRKMADGGVADIVSRELTAAARPFAPQVRAAILNIPVKGLKPWPPQEPGLRLRIARCVVAWSRAGGGVIQVGVKVDPSRMPSGQYSLPLGMDGRKRWRHPVFGDRENWVTQVPHPYFDAATAPMGPASKRAIDRALERITRAISG
jgi:hypothetical protein